VAQCALPGDRCPRAGRAAAGRGEEILRYDINDLIRDTGFRLRVTSTGDGMNRAIRSHHALETASRVCARSATGENRE
jgi:hypothetical protein